MSAIAVPSNILSGIDVIDDGTKRVAKLEHPKNAPSPIFVTPSTDGTLSVAIVEFLNASFPMAVTVAGRVTVVTVELAKAFLSTSTTVYVTPSSTNVDGTATSPV
jgi:hypothetical protein